MANRRAKASRDIRAGRIEVRNGVREMTKSFRRIEVSLRRAEREIEAEARDRLRRLRREAKTKLAVLRGHHREASRLLTRLSTAADGSWGDVKKAADRALKNAREISDSMIARFRRAVTE